MTNITLRQLKYFEALAKTGHFGRAADRCGVSQPALSVQIKELEGELGAPLFERSARKANLTPLGSEFSQRSTEILRAVEELGDLARAARETLVGHLRLGVIPTIAPYLLPAIIGRLMIALPDIDIHVRETLTSRLIEDLNSGRLDAAIVALPISEPGLTEIELFREEFVLVRPEADAGKPVPDRAGMSEMRLLLLEEGHCFRDQALSFCQMRTPLAREGLDGSSLSTLVQMVASGIGVTLIPDMAVPIETRGTSVSLGRFSPPAPQRAVGMVWRSSSPLGAQFRQIASVVQAAAQSSG